MSGTGKRFNAGKTRYDLLNPIAINGLAKAFTKGAAKYGDRNWEKGMPWSTVMASMKRHQAAIEMGEDYDKETGCLHADLIQANAHILSSYYKIHPQGDDRKKYFDLRVGLDIDGVLANFEKAIKKRYNIDNGANHWLYSYKFNKNMRDELNNDRDFWVNIEPYFDGSEMPFEPVCYVTHRNIPAEWCMDWLEKNNFPCVPVFVTGESKVNILKSIDLDAFVDDKYDNFVELNNAGIFTYLYSQDWNTKYNVGHRRIYSLNEIVKRQYGSNV